MRHPWAWAVLAGLGAAALAATAALGPLVPLVVLAAVVGVVLAVVAPRALALLAVVVIIASAPLEDALGGPAPYADEAAVALCALALPVRRLLLLGRLVWFPGTAWFAAYLGLGVLSSLAADVPAAIAAPAAFLAVKGLLLAFALAQLNWRVVDLRLLAVAGAVAAGVMVLSGLANLAAPGAWARLTTGQAPLDHVGLLPALNGVFGHPAAFSRFCGVLAVGALAWLLVVRRSPSVVALCAACGMLAVLSLQVKSVVGLLLTFAVLGARFLRPAGAVVAALLTPLVALVVGPPLWSLVSGDVDLYVLQPSARSLLVEGGVTVASRFFPLGAGFGRYGSSVAADDYSPLYYELGFADRFGLAPGASSGQFLNDSQWPALFGEAGWIGAACFAVGLACVLVRLLRVTSPDESPLVRWVRVMGAGWVVLLVIESLASPVFVSAPSFPFLFAAAGVAASCAARARAPDGQVERRSRTLAR